MTIVETAILAAGIGIGLFVIGGGVGAVRQQAKRNLCVRLMAGLNASLAAYFRATGLYPPGTPDSSAGSAITALQAVDASAAALHPLPDSLEVGEDPVIGCRDPWGTPLRYLTAEASNERDRREVAANGGVPIFESAGRDREFGAADPRLATDNLRTSDLP